MDRRIDRHSLPSTAITAILFRRQIQHSLSLPVALSRFWRANP
jgi:hypothetical protein